MVSLINCLEPYLCGYLILEKYLCRVHTGEKIDFYIVASIRDKIDRVDSVANRDKKIDCTFDFVAKMR